MAYREIYVNDRRRIEPIGAVYNSAMEIRLKVMDKAIPNSAKVTAYSRSEYGVVESKSVITVADNTITFNTDAGFFQPGKNQLQVDIPVTGGKVITFIMDVLCDDDIRSGGTIVPPVTIKTYAEQAVEAAERAESAAKQAVDAVADNVYTIPLVSACWIPGNIGDNTGADPDKPLANRLTSLYFSAPKYKIVITPAAGYWYRVMFYYIDNNGEYKWIADGSVNDWARGYLEVPVPANATICRLGLRRQTGDAISPDDFKGDEIKVDLYDVPAFNNSATNIVDMLDWNYGEYYQNGVIKNHTGVKSTVPIKLAPGALIRMAGSTPASTRISFWRDTAHESDVTLKPSLFTTVRIPDNCNAVSFTAWLAYDYYLGGNFIYISDANGNAGTVLPELFAPYNSPLAVKRVSILGDSISTFGGSPDDDPTDRKSDGTWTYEWNRCRYPQNNLLTDVNRTYWKRVIDKYRMVLGINESWAGSRVSNQSDTDSGDVGPNRHMASITRIGHLGGKGTPDLIIVFGGTNDIGNNVEVGTFNAENPIDYTDEQIAALPVGTFADAYRTMLIRIQHSYPTARVVCILPYFTTNRDNAKLDEYNEVIKEACDYFGVPVCDARTCGMTIFNRRTYLPDGTHLNAYGMDLLATALENTLKTLWG